MTATAQSLPWRSPKPYLRDMGREANIEITNIEILRKSGSTRTGHDTSAPTHFTARCILARPPLSVDMDVRVPMGGIAQIRKLVVKPLGEPTVTSGLLRSVALDRLLREAMRKAETRNVVARDDIGSDAFQLPGDDEDAYRVGVVTSRVQQRADERAARAAEIYKDALAQGSRAPGEAVAIKLDRSRGQAAVYIRRAREMGLLPPLGQADDDAG